MTFSTAANDTVEQRDFYQTYTAYRLANVNVRFPGVTVQVWAMCLNWVNSLTKRQVRIQPVRSGGGRFQQYLVAKSHSGFATVRGTTYTSQQTVWQISGWQNGFISHMLPFELHKSQTCA